jgi:hypothetical protein
MRRFAKVLWRLMPRLLREAMALEAPIVLDRYEFQHHDRTWPSWVRMEIDLGVTTVGWDSEREQPISFTYDHKWGPERLEETPVYATPEDAYAALTQRLARDRRFVLTENKRVFRPDPDEAPPPRLLKAPAYDSDEVSF